MNDNQSTTKIGIVFICLLAILGVVAICCPNCFSWTQQAPAPPAMPPQQQTIAPPPQQTTPPPTQEVVKEVVKVIEVEESYSCTTNVNLAVSPKRKVFLCRGEGLTFTVTVGTGNVDPIVRIYIDGNLYRTLDVYYSASVDFRGSLASGWHAVRAVSQIPGCSEGEDSESFEIGDCYSSWGAPCCCYSGCGTYCPTCHGNPPPPPTEEPCPPGNPPPPPPSPTEEPCPPVNPATPPPPPPPSGSQPSGGGQAPPSTGQSASRPD